MNKRRSTLPEVKQQFRGALGLTRIRWGNPASSYGLFRPDPVRFPVIGDRVYAGCGG
jgi:hypothetical protein